MTFVCYVSGCSHPTDYELAVNYFLEEFAGDVAFARTSEPEQMPHLLAVLNIVVSKTMGHGVEVANAENIGSSMATRRRTGGSRCASTSTMLTPRSC